MATTIRQVTNTLGKAGGRIVTDSCIKSKVKILDKIQKRAIRVIDNKSNHGLNYEQLLNVYNLQPLIRRREQHQLCMMYRMSTNDYYLERHSSGKELRSTRKIKFEMKCTGLTKIMNSPTIGQLDCGINYQ